MTTAFKTVLSLFLIVMASFAFGDDISALRVCTVAGPEALVLTQ